MSWEHKGNLTRRDFLKLGATAVVAYFLKDWLLDEPGPGSETPIQYPYPGLARDDDTCF